MDDDNDFAVLSRGIMLDGPERDLSLLKQKLRDPAKDYPTRSVFTGGAPVASQVTTTSITIDPLPVMAATVRYYQPQSLPK